MIAGAGRKAKVPPPARKGWGVALLHDGGQLSAWERPELNCRSVRRQGRKCCDSRVISGYAAETLTNSRFADLDTMEIGGLMMRHWAKGRGRTPRILLTFLPGLSNSRQAWQEVTAGVLKTVDDQLESAVRWRTGMGCSHSRVNVRKFSSNGVDLKRKKLMPLQERKMIDKFRLHVRGGDGGAGCSSFRKSIQARHGSADGGNGGSGGDVILVSSAAVWDFSNLQHHLNGTRGGQGSSKKKVGSRGKDKIVQIPVGTVIHVVRGFIPSLGQVFRPQEEPAWEDWEGVVSMEKNRVCDKSQLVQNSQPLEHCVDPGKHGWDASKRSSITQIRRSPSEGDTSMSRESSEEYGGGGPSSQEDEDDSLEQDTQFSVAEFVNVGQSLVVARGGFGGKGNAAMGRGRGSEKTLPSLEHEPGQPGSEADLILELKTIADVGLVGAPNAGKSTLLGSLSAAAPTTGHYKFTTLRPNIGTVEFDDFFSLTVADIPGLIEGAHINKGLGHAFLRHIERTKVLVYVLDLASGIGDDTGPLPWEQFEELVFELEQYKKGLSQRPSIVAANKIDEEGVVIQLEMLRQKVPFLEIYATCAVLNEGVEELKGAIRRLVESSQIKSTPLLELSERTN